LRRLLRYFQLIAGNFIVDACLITIWLERPDLGKRLVRELLAKRLFFNLYLGALATEKEADRE
jgi:hypothetical protein